MQALDIGKIEILNLFRKLGLLRFTSLLCLFCLNVTYVSDMNIMALRPVCSFILLAIIPGALLLQILDEDFFTDLRDIVPFCIGLSIVLVSILGFVLSLFWQVVSDTPPLSSIGVVIGVNILIGGLVIASYVSGKSSRYGKDPLALVRNYPRITLSVILLPVFSLIGSYYINTLRIDIITSFVFVAIIFLIWAVVAGDLDERIYPLTLWAIAFSIFFLVSFRSQYVTNWDTAFVYSSIENVITTGLWEPDQTAFAKNSIIPVIVAAPIFVQVSELSLTTVMKILYPTIYSFLPVTLYQMVKGQGFNKKESFLAAGLFLSFDATILGIPRLYRQALSMFFITLFLYILLEYTVSRSRSILLALVGYGIVISHYATSYLFMLSFVPLIGIVVLTHFNPKIKNRLNLDFRKRIIPAFSIILIGNVVWQMYTSNFFNGFVRLGVYLMNSISEASSSSQTAREVGDVPTQVFPLLTRILMYALIGLIGLGIAVVVFSHFFGFLDKWSREIDDELLIIAGSGFTILVSTLALPYPYFTTTRLYAIVSILVVPFFVIGVQSSSSLARRAVSRTPATTTLVMVFVIVFFSLNAGIPQEAAGDDHNNFVIETPDESDSLAEVADILDSSSRTTEADIRAITWIQSHGEIERVYTDSLLDTPFTAYGGLDRATRDREIHDVIRYPGKRSISPTGYTYSGDNVSVETDQNICMYLGSANLNDGVVKYREDWVTHANASYLRTGPVKGSFDRSLNRIYSGGETGYWCN
ncbi:DUF2206 domain-containing protein [Halorubrum sp. Atlit-8R]|nr:DUF2206 domain-containing protein [Halorubrum sp. Atlit-9R]RLM83303.1 DUF2206 domain-containing protein [Halorubrum sp. Atlit-8R]